MSPALALPEAPPREGGRRRGGRRAPEISLRDDEREELERLARSGKTEQRIATRARVVLRAASGEENRAIAAALAICEDTAGLWRKRYREHGPKGLRDAPRSGRPPRYGPEVKAAVVKIAIEQSPRQNGLPVTHWSSEHLAKLMANMAEFLKTGAPDRSTVGKWLRNADLKPHLVRYWLKITAPDFDERMKDVTSLYVRAPELAKQAIPVFCLDEKTSIQALERMTADLPMKPGKTHRRDHRYKRHGTTTLLGSFEVATGMVARTFTEKRPAAVVAKWIQGVCESRHAAPAIHLVMDQLSTHWHHDVCRVVAELSGVEYDPTRHRNGAQRKAFLADASKRVVIHFTPVRASWLDQIEIWFSILGRKVVNRGSFTSVDDVQQRIDEFIDYYNRFLAHPFRWTYTGAVGKK